MKTGGRKLSLNQDEKLRTTHKTVANEEPPKFNSFGTKLNSFGTKFDHPINQFYFLWLLLRRQSHVEQIVPKKEIPIYQLKKTSKAYLSPIL